LSKSSKKSRKQDEELIRSIVVIDGEGDNRRVKIHLGPLREMHAINECLDALGKRYDGKSQPRLTRSKSHRDFAVITPKRVRDLDTIMRTANRLVAIGLNKARRQRGHNPQHASQPQIGPALIPARS